MRNDRGGALPNRVRRRLGEQVRNGKRNLAPTELPDENAAGHGKEVSSDSHKSLLNFFRKVKHFGCT